MGMAQGRKWRICPIILWNWWGNKSESRHGVKVHEQRMDKAAVATDQRLPLTSTTLNCYQIWDHTDGFTVCVEVKVGAKRQTAAVFLCVGKGHAVTQDICPWTGPSGFLAIFHFIFVDPNMFEAFVPFMSIKKTPLCTFIILFFRCSLTKTKSHKTGALSTVTLSFLCVYPQRHTFIMRRTKWHRPPACTCTHRGSVWVRWGSFSPFSLDHWLRIGARLWTQYRALPQTHTVKLNKVKQCRCIEMWRVAAVQTLPNDPTVPTNGSQVCVCVSFSYSPLTLWSVLYFIILPFSNF